MSRRSSSIYGPDSSSGISHSPKHSGIYGQGSGHRVEAEVDALVDRASAHQDALAKLGTIIDKHSSIRDTVTEKLIKDEAQHDDWGGHTPPLGFGDE